jgi:predicted nucleotidyltransferase
MDDITHAQPTASGRFLLRLPAALHDALRAAAREAGLSLNEFCCRKLAAPGSAAVAPGGTAEAIAWADRLFGDRLLAVLAYGSWARSQARPDSDVDLLVVLDQRSPITRDLYRRWDERRLEVEGHEVEPHFVHLPAMKKTGSGLWAEVALDGILLFERGHDVSRYLARVRRDVIEGRLVRRTVHGQPYWAEVA